MFVYRDTQKFSDTLEPMEGIFLKRILIYLRMSFKCTKACFVCSIAEKISGILWAMLGKG